MLGPQRVGLEVCVTTLKILCSLASSWLPRAGTSRTPSQGVKIPVSAWAFGKAPPFDICNRVGYVYKAAMSANCRFVTAVHVLTVLAYKQGDCVSSAVLASSVNTNPVIVRRLLLTLQAADLVETTKGPGSGSRLSRSAVRINLAQVYRAVELEEPFAFPRKQPNHACPIGQGIRAVLERVCRRASRAVERDLSRITLASVLDGITVARPVQLKRGSREFESASYRRRQL